MDTNWSEQDVPVTIRGKEVIAKVSGHHTHEMVQILAVLYDREEIMKGEPILTDMIVKGKNLRLLSVSKEIWKSLYPRIRTMDITNCILYNGGENIYLIVFEDDAVKVDRVMQSVMHKQAHVGDDSQQNNRNPLQARIKKNDHRFVQNWINGREEVRYKKNGGSYDVGKGTQIEIDGISAGDCTAGIG